MSANLISQIIVFLESRQGGIAVIFVVAAGFWQYWRYVKEWNFKNYHKLIKELTQSDTPGEHIKLDRQVAVVYELRNYPRYFFVSKRILKGWLDLSNEKDEREHIRLYNEMKLSIEYMNKCFLARCWNKIFRK